MSTRSLPAYMYRVPDPDDRRVADLEAALLESNDTAAALRAQMCEECERTLAVKVAGLIEYRWAGVNSRADSPSVTELEADGWQIEHVDERYGTRLMRRAAP